MGVKMVLGCSGAGKTYYCVEHMLEEANKHEEQQYIMIVPEQFTLATQLELVTKSKRGGILNLDVLSFNRLAYKVFSKVPNMNKQVLDDLGKTLILRRIIQEKKDELIYLGKGANKLGVIDEIKSMLAELYQFDMSPKALEEVANICKDKLLEFKLRDMANIYEAFDTYINKMELSVAEETLSLLSEAIEVSDCLQGVTVCFDGFTGFTPIQYKLLNKLSKQAAEMIVTVCIDDFFDINAPIETHELFNLSKRTVQQVTQLCKDNSVDIEYIRVNEGINYRHRENEELAHLEKYLFRFPYNSYQGKTKNILVKSYSSPVLEIENVALNIIDMVRHMNYRYKDIAIICAESKVYYGHIEKIFNECDIPVFLDSKRSILNNPVSKLVCGLLELSDSDYEYSTIIKLFRIGLCNNFTVEGEEYAITEKELDNLDNYLLATGIRGYNAWNKPFIRRTRAKITDEQLIDINSTREKINLLLGDICLGLADKELTVRSKLCLLHSFLVKTHSEEKLLAMADLFKEKGELLRHREFSQVYSKIIEVLDKIYSSILDEKMTPKELLEIIKLGLEKEKVGLIPPSIDQVVVGDLIRTRLKDIKVLFFIGVNDGAVPHIQSKGGIINDDDREILLKNNIQIAPTCRQKIFEEQFYLYLNLTKPTDKLFITFSRSTNEKKNIEPAYLIGRLSRLFKELKVDYIEEYERSFDKLFTAKRIEKMLVKGIRTNGVKNELFDEILTIYLKDSNKSKALYRYIDAAYCVNEEDNISKEVIKALYSDRFMMAVSRIEAFNKCPYSFLMKYGIALREREVRSLMNTDMGNIMHEALEKFSNELSNSHKQWKEVSEEDIEDMTDRILNKISEEYGNGIMQSTFKNKYILDKYKQITKKSLRVLREHLKKGDFVPYAFECKFDAEKDNLTGMRIELSDGTKINLMGVIDRIDIFNNKYDKTYVKVIDYKTGNTNLSYEKIVNGLQLQLFVYLKAAREKLAAELGKKIMPAGTMYYHIKNPMLEVETASEVKWLKEGLEEFKMSGMVLSDIHIIKAMDSDVEAATKSKIIPVGLSVDGDYLSSAVVSNEEGFDYIDSFIEKQIVEVGEQIITGFCKRRPYKDAKDTGCTYCEYKSICKFEQSLGNKYKYVKKVKNSSEFWNIVKGGGGVNGDTMDSGTVEDTEL